MDDKLSNPARAKASLAAALRVARAEDAERSDVIADLRTLAIARLAVLRDALEPVLAQIPAEVDLFDVGLMPGDPPRLFIDMVAFVEMARDRRTYRLVQDRRHARAVIYEGEGAHAALSAVTAYVARRLVEREQLLSSMGRNDPPAPPAAVPPPPLPGRRPMAPRLLRAARLVVDGFGLATLGGLAWLGLRTGSVRFPPW